MGWTEASTRVAPWVTADCRTWNASEVLVSQMTASGALNGVAIAARCTTASGRTRAKTASVAAASVRSTAICSAAGSPGSSARSSEITSWPLPTSPVTTLAPSRPAPPVTTTFTAHLR